MGITPGTSELSTHLILEEKKRGGNKNITLTFNLSGEKKITYAKASKDGKGDNDQICFSSPRAFHKKKIKY